MEFANWAFMTPEARSEADRGRMAVNAALKATECTKALCEYVLTSKLPEEITGAESTADPAEPCRCACAPCTDTPTLHTQRRVAAVSSCGDPPTGWTVSNHGLPQRAFSRGLGQAFQQENVPPSPCASVPLTEHAASTSAGAQPGRSVPQNFGGGCEWQSSNHVNPPHRHHEPTELPADVLDGGVTYFFLYPTRSQPQ